MKNILCFAAHPDDLEFSCIATLKKFKDKGNLIYFVIATNGENGFKKFRTSAKERIKIRKQEQLMAAKKIGAEQVVFLDYKDGFLEYNDSVREKIVGLIRQFKPDNVFSFDPANRAFDNLNLYHRDHRILAEVVFDSCFAARNKFMYNGKVHAVDEIFFFGSDQPNYYEDITDLIDFKLEMIKYHGSQFTDFNEVEEYVKKIISKGSDKYLYCERFRRLKLKQLQKYNYE